MKFLVSADALSNICPLWTFQLNLKFNLCHNFKLWETGRTSEYHLHPFAGVEPSLLLRTCALFFLQPGTWQEAGAGGWNIPLRFLASHRGLCWWVLLQRLAFWCCSCICHVEFVPFSSSPISLSLWGLLQRLWEIHKKLQFTGVLCFHSPLPAVLWELRGDPTSSLPIEDRGAILALRKSALLALASCKYVPSGDCTGRSLLFSFSSPTGICFFIHLNRT